MSNETVEATPEVVVNESVGTEESDLNQGNISFDDLDALTETRDSKELMNEAKDFLRRGVKTRLRQKKSSPVIRLKTKEKRRLKQKKRLKRELKLKQIRQRKLNIRLGLLKTSHRTLPKTLYFHTRWMVKK